MNTQSDFHISDLESFNAVTDDPRQVARLYFYSMVDPLIDLAYKVSCDFFMRPHMYTDLGQTSAGEGKSRPLTVVLAELHARSGSSEFFPSCEQRREIYEAIFGAPSGSAMPQDDSFPRLRDALFAAATAFALNREGTGVEVLRENVKKTVRPLANYLAGFHGDSLKWSAGEALSSLTEDVSYTILRNNGVAGVFGFTTAPTAKWPYGEDSNADKLVEAISKQLAPDLAMGGGWNTRESCSTFQRAAARGAEALAVIVSFAEAQDDDLDRLITRVYTWGSALSAMNAERKPAQPAPGARTAASGSGGAKLYNPLMK
jgi:hypothetical protein